MRFSVTFSLHYLFNILFSNRPFGGQILSEHSDMPSGKVYQLLVSKFDPGILRDYRET